MRKYLISKELNSYKANLHCHSTLSDGKLSVEKIRDEYKKHGYSIVAFTDHNCMFNNYEKLLEPDFLPIVGMEVSIDDTRSPFNINRVVHLCFLSKDPKKTVQPFYCQSGIDWLVNCGFLPKEIADNIEHNGITIDDGLYNQKVNDVIKAVNNEGFLVTINHPFWSLLNYNDYANYEGAWGIEVYNTGCAKGMGDVNDERAYDDMLKCGKKIFPICADDNHNHHPFSSYLSDSFGGFTMIKAKNLEYGEIMTALENGDFYSSTGPQIHEIYFEGDRLHIECSEAKEVILNVLTRDGRRKANDDGSPITSADFTIDPVITGGYFRVKVVGLDGSSAYTIPYYVDELIEGSTTQKAIY